MVAILARSERARMATKAAGKVGRGKDACFGRGDSRGLAVRNGRGQPFFGSDTCINTRITIFLPIHVIRITRTYLL